MVCGKNSRVLPGSQPLNGMAKTKCCHRLAGNDAYDSQKYIFQNTCYFLSNPLFILNKRADAQQHMTQPTLLTGDYDVFQLGDLSQPASALERISKRCRMPYDLINAIIARIHSRLSFESIGMPTSPKTALLRATFLRLSSRRTRGHPLPYSYPSRIGHTMAAPLVPATPSICLYTATRRVRLTESQIHEQKKKMKSRTDKFDM